MDGTVGVGVASTFQVVDTLGANVSMITGVMKAYSPVGAVYAAEICVDGEMKKYLVRLTVEQLIYFKSLLRTTNPVMMTR